MSYEKSDSDFNQFKEARGLYVEDPWERVKFIFMKNVYGEYHPDLAQAMHVGYTAFLAGAGIGGAISQRNYLLELKERSDANIYHSKTDAYRQLSRESMKGFLKGAFKWGPRLGFFSGGFMLFASCVEAYRNKPGIIEYSLGGLGIGCVMRSNFGIRGALVGGLVGMILGTIYGIAYLGMCKITKKDAMEIKYGQYALIKYLDEIKAQKNMTKESSKLGQIQTNEDYINPLNTWVDGNQSVNNKAEENLNK